MSGESEGTHQGGAYTDFVWRIARGVEVVPGVRVDIYRSTRDGLGTTTTAAIDPRLASRTRLSPRGTWLSAIAIAHQYPALRVGAAPGDVATVPGFAPGHLELQAAFQKSEGIEWRLPANVTMTTSAFLNEQIGLTDLTSDCASVSPAPPGVGPPTTPTRYVCSDAAVRGRSYGFELLARRPIAERFAAWFSYTLSRSTNGASVSAYDRTHVLSAAAEVDLGRRWKLGARVVAYSGRPYEHDRFPPFVRGDLRVEKRWLLRGGGTVAFVADVQNVTFSHEPSGMECLANGACTMSSTETTIPSVGLEISS